jgi:hypothetical protein
MPGVFVHTHQVKQVIEYGGYGLHGLAPVALLGAIVITTLILTAILVVVSVVLVNASVVISVLGARLIVLASGAVVVMILMSRVTSVLIDLTVGVLGCRRLV